MRQKKQFKLSTTLILIRNRCGEKFGLFSPCATSKRSEKFSQEEVNDDEDDDG